MNSLVLSPLGEEDCIQYVAATLCRPKQEVSALAMVIHVKTAGNPFYMREMLSACHRKKCIWYDYHTSQWKYDVNRVFEQFKGDTNYDILNTDFITNRLNELPPSSRSILAWASLLGNSFSFELICHLLAGEFYYLDESCPEPHSEHYHVAYSQQDAVIGLQAAIQACILTPTETDDRFRFAHDRYIQAASKLKECNSRKMHFIIAQTMLKYYGVDTRSKDSAASHICESVDIIKKRVRQRRPFRKLLFDCARLATENGARPTAAKYYSNDMALLQDNPWDDGDDASYDETLQLYLRAAECYLYMGQFPLANGILATLFECAKGPLDKAPAWVLQSRIFAQSGNSSTALACLIDCLYAMGVTQVHEIPTFESCDREFDRLSTKIQVASRADIVNGPDSHDHVVTSAGAVLAEAISAGWWGDPLMFYHLSLVMLDMHLTSGAFTQSGMALLHTAMVAISRFNKVQLAVDLASYALELLDRFRDPFSMARGYMLYANFIAHVQFPIGLTVTQLEGSIEYSVAAGDRISAILSFGLAAQVRFFASESCSDLEAFCTYGCEEIPNWHQDTRGGTMLIAVRQATRALQGKTDVSDPLQIMSDDQHNAVSYKQWLDGNHINGHRSLLFYETIELIPLYLCGHYERVVEVGKRCLERAPLIWSSRNTRLTMLCYGLALSGLILRQRSDPRGTAVDMAVEAENALGQLELFVSEIKAWAAVSDVNYLVWWKLLEAQISEISNDQGRAIQQYEEALDHASEHNFVFEEALGNYLMAGIFIRHCARRSAKSALRDAIGLYRQLGATGVADRIEDDHSLLLRGPTRNPRTVDVGVQTDFAADAGLGPVPRRRGRWPRCVYRSTGRGRPGRGDRGAHRRLERLDAPARGRRRPARPRHDRPTCHPAVVAGHILGPPGGPAPEDHV